MNTNPRIGGIRQQTCPVGDAAGTTLLSVIATSLAYAELWAVLPDGDARQIGRGDVSLVGKVDSASPGVLQDGTPRLWVGAADVGGGGATTHTAFFDFPDERFVLQPPAAIDQPARWQANAAQKTANLAVNQVASLAVRVDANEAAIAALEAEG